MHRARVRCVPRVSLRRPAEKDFPGDRSKAVDFDASLQEVLQGE